ncbi:DUF5050 domain-containing protein [Bacillus sp. FJAT-50079]|uniref:DUF5050 domain-containing protein n=1 Tax=Bacillus sp. FJAT-50079 TaxID=2833577 RepID=UPI001BCA4557|nr:DUF5050 domain-containing protein [Bacillus sp. FJAT-50079]MBS4209437.1 DUF5050 domain-containing protein [Bacillus sp. FJAT-50079]
MKKGIFILISMFLLCACSKATENIQEDQEVNIGQQEEDIAANNELAEVDDHEVEQEGQPSFIHSSGNVKAGGRFIYANDWVYFANLFDENHLYKMKADGTEVSKLTEHPVTNIQLVRDWIYYVQLDYDDMYPIHLSINRVNVDGGDASVVLEHPVGELHVFGNDLIFIMDDKVHTMNINEKEAVSLPYTAFSMSVFENQIVFYNHAGYHLGDIKGSEAEELFLESYGDFVFEENNLYFTHFEGESGLFRYSLADKEKYHIITEPVDFFNVDGNTIYYSTAENEVDRSIYSVNTSGEDKTDLGAYITSIYLFDQYLLGDYARQGVGAIILMNRETGESKELFIDAQ